ncbi:MAG: hypothetical protein SFT92_09945 [Rickettsiales bacterium]|nr:hypothetical protein [Rickettsiales bacterium]
MNHSACSTASNELDDLDSITLLNASGIIRITRHDLLIALDRHATQIQLQLYDKLHDCHRSGEFARLTIHFNLHKN